MVQTFFGGFTGGGFYGDKNMILVRFFLCHGCSKKHYGSFLSVHRER